MRRQLATAAIIAIVCAGAVAARVWYDGARALDAGDAAAARGDRAAALAHWRRAAATALPGAPHVAAARARLASSGSAAPEAPEVPPVSGIPEVPPVSGIPEVPPVSGIPEVPPVSGIPEVPPVSGILAALVGFGLWIGGCAYFAARALDGEDRLVRRAAAGAGGLVLVGVVVWAVGLYNAGGSG